MDRGFSSRTNETGGGIKLQDPTSDVEEGGGGKLLSIQFHNTNRMMEEQRRYESVTKVLRL